MRKYLASILCALAFLTISSSANAQQDSLLLKDSKIKEGKGSPRLSRMIERVERGWATPDEEDTTIISHLLRLNTPMLPEFNTNRLFTFTSKNKNYAFSLGAMVKASLMVSYGDGNDSESNDPKHLGEFMMNDKTAGNIHITGSNIAFNFVGAPKAGHYIAAFIGLRVSQNDDYHPRLDYAYVRYNYLLVGKTSTTYDDNISSLFVIDPADAVASGSGSNMQISYQPIYKDWRFGVALEQIRSSYTYANPEVKMATTSQIIPDVPFYVSYEPSSKWHIRLTGLVRGLRYTDQQDLDDPSVHTKFGWGVKLTGHWDTYPFKGFWQVQTGQGNASFFSANRDMNLDLVPDAKRPGYLKTPTHLGSTIGAQYNWKKNVYSVLRASYLKNWIDRYEGGTRDYNSLNSNLFNANLNAIWEVNRMLCCGVEYSYCTTQRYNNTWYNNHQVMTMAYVSF